MLFSSIPFLFYFLPLFLVCYFSFTSLRNPILLFFSIAFYAWGEFRYLPLLFAFIVVNWAVGLRLGPDKWGRRLALWLGIAFNVALLLVYKYWDFLIAQLDALADTLGVTPLEAPSIPLALGVSFFAFQGVSYLVDVFQGRVVAQNDLLKFATYKAMFPPLLAGPVVRYADVARDLGRRCISVERVRRGLYFFIIGLAQKTLIADTVATTADAAFGVDANLLSASTAWVGVVAYTIQIYFDFAGYSNIAIGLGHIIGFSLPRNFDRPYIATSVTEFWHRWHMTLSAWFRDYLYIPLGGNRCGAGRTYFNLVIVFLLCGLWHGANWTFVGWGACHGILLVIERMGFARLISRWWLPLQHAYLLAAIALTWVIFRSPSLEHAIAYFTAMCTISKQDSLSLAQILDVRELLAIIAGAWLATAKAPTVLEVTKALRRFGATQSIVGLSARAISDTLMVALLFASAVTLAATTYRPFIYFRF